MVSPQNSTIVRRLIDEGVIPPECTRFQLTADARDVLRMSLEVFISDEQLQKIADALIDSPEEAKRIAREIVFRGYDRDGSSSVTVDL